jgi:hypothetical protein
MRTCVECCVVRACVECFVEKEQGFMQVSSRWPFLPITPSHEQFSAVVAMAWVRRTTLGVVWTPN